MSDSTSSPRSGASAARHATGDPQVFMIPERALPPGFGDLVDAGDFEPVQPRPASTVVLIREGAAEPEVLLLRRHGRSGFAANAWVFPGGVVDAADADLSLVDRLDGPTPSEWAERLGLPAAAEAVGYVVAAMREAFEETGILLARGVQADSLEADALEVARRALLADVVGLRQIAVNQDLHLAADQMVYLAHWITPEPEPRRYDTRFFLARVGADAVALPHAEELTDSEWLSPAEAVRRFEEHQLRLLPPTVHTLRRLAGYATLDAMFADLGGAPVPSILPTMRREPDGVAIVLPPEASLS